MERLYKDLGEALADAKMLSAAGLQPTFSRLQEAYAVEWNDGLGMYLIKAGDKLVARWNECKWLKLVFGEGNQGIVVRALGRREAVDVFNKPRLPQHRVTEEDVLISKLG